MRLEGKLTCVKSFLALSRSKGLTWSRASVGSSDAMHVLHFSVVSNENDATVKDVHISTRLSPIPRSFPRTASHQ
jgi:hypothetical protein